MATTADELATDELTTTTPMAIVSLTPEARRVVREALDQEPEPESLALWLEVRGVQNGAFVYDLYFQARSDAAAEDEVHPDGDVQVVVPAGSVDRLRGARLEWSEEGDGGLVLVNPNTPTLEETAPGIPPEVLAAGITGPLAQRVVNVLDLLVLDSPRTHPHGMSDDAFAALFPLATEVIFAFHGYPSAVRQLLFSRPQPHRFHVVGYQEEGTTTTPFDMTVRNGISRYQLAIEALRRAPRVASAASEMIDRYERALADHRRYIEANGVDPPEIADWRWS